MIAERTPCVGHLGLETDRAPQGCDRAFAIATGTERQAKLVVGGCPVRLRSCKRLEDRLRRGCIARASIRHTEQQRRQRMAWRNLQDFRCLFGREPGLRGHQALRVSERRFERSNRF
jgi:hypothetical protein